MAFFIQDFVYFSYIIELIGCFVQLKYLDYTS